MFIGFGILLVHVAVTIWIYHLRVTDQSELAHSDMVLFVLPGACALASYLIISRQIGPKSLSGAMLKVALSLGAVGLGIIIALGIALNSWGG